MWVGVWRRGELGWSAQTNLHNASRQGNPLALGAFDFLDFRFEYILVTSCVRNGTCRFQSSCCSYPCQGQRAKIIPDALTSTGRLCCLPPCPVNVNLIGCSEANLRGDSAPFPAAPSPPPTTCSFRRPPPGGATVSAGIPSLLPPHPQSVPSASSDLGKARARSLSPYVHGRCCRAAQESKQGCSRNSDAKVGRCLLYLCSSSSFYASSSSFCL